jgi:hypothetical protein
MLRPLLAGGLMLALASAGASQSVSPQDAALSPMEIISNLAKQPAASEAAKAPKPGAEPGTKDATKQPDAAAKKPDVATPKAAAAKHDIDSLEQCLNDWDRATHMTRAEWARTCRRVAANRARFLREQQAK